MTGKREVGAFLIALVALLAPAAAEDTTRVEVRVTLAAGNSVYIDKGSAAGLRIGDLVVFSDPDRGRIEADLTVVATTSARAVMKGGIAPPEAGVHGEVIIPSERLTKKPETAPKTGPAGEEKTPEHPEWKRKEEPRKPEEPLLSPAFHVDRTDLPVKWRGRIYANLLSNLDRQGDQDVRYFLARIGADARARNLFGRGGLFRIAFSGEERRTDVSGGTNRSDGKFRLDRLSYEWGGGIDSPVLVQIGRFLPRDTPELGLVDGIEGSYDVGFGRLDLDFGALPVPQMDRRSFDDVGATLGWRYAAGKNESFVSGVAFQQTWHKGRKDRTLVLAKFSYTPSLDFTSFGSVWIDFYDGSDTAKTASAELTELHLNGSWRLSSDHRLGLGFTRIRWPELLRDEFAVIDPTYIRRNRVTRIDGSLSSRLATHVRLDTRLGWWQDQDDNGVTGSATLRTPDLVAKGLDLSAGVFRTDGTISKGYGLRLGARQSFSTALVSMGYELSRREISTFLSGETSKLTQQAIFTTLDLPLSRSVSLSLNGDYRFGDGQNAVSLSVFVQYRF